MGPMVITSRKKRAIENMYSMMDKIYVDTPTEPLRSTADSGGENAINPTSFVIPIYVSTPIHRGDEKTPNHPKPFQRFIIHNK
jgi:hypothetical protein